MIKRPIIIDTDPGVDDTIAIMLANAHPEFDIKAITPVLGNVSYSFTSENALGLVEYLGIDCKIGIGADQPLFIKGMDSDGVHGKGGLGGYMLKNSGREFDGYAWDIIRDEAIKAGGELELITLGPLTNIAITFMRYPEIKPLSNVLSVWVVLHMKVILHQKQNSMYGLTLMHSIMYSTAVYLL